MTYYPLEKNISGVVFIGNKGSKLLSTENNFVYDSGNNRLGINTGTPLYTLDVNGTGNFIAIRFPDGTIQSTAGAGSGFNYYDFNLAVGNESSTVISSGETVSFTGFGNITVTRSGNVIRVSGVDTNTTYSAGTGLNLVGTVFNVSGSTTSGSGIVQLQDSIQDNVTNRAVTPNAVFDYVGGVSGALDTRLNTTGNTLIDLINGKDNYQYWTLRGDAATTTQVDTTETVQFTGAGNVSVTLGGTDNRTVTISGIDSNTTYNAGSGLQLIGDTFHLGGTGELSSLLFNNNKIRIGNTIPISNTPDKSIIIGDILKNANSSSSIGMGWPAVILGNDTLLNFSGTVTIPTLIGHGALLNSSGNNNIHNTPIFLGYSVGYGAINSDNTILIGVSAGQEFHDSFDSYIIGTYGGYKSSGCAGNICMGYFTSPYNTGSTYNINLGVYAGSYHQNTIGCIAIGQYTSIARMNSNYSISIGDNAHGSTFPTYFSNIPTTFYKSDNAIAIGYYSSYESPETSYNISLGNYTNSFASGTYNVFIGSYAGAEATGNNNLEIVTSGNTSSIIGNNSNKIHINNILAGDTSTKRLAIGSVGAANLNPNATLEILPNVSTDKVLIVKGAASQTANLTEWQNSIGNSLAIIDNNAQLRLGTGSPSYKLDVDGIGNFTSGVRYPDGLTQVIAYTGLNDIATSGYVQSVSGAIDTRLIATGNNLQGQINSVSGLLYNYWTLIAPGASPDNITKEQSVTFTGAGATSVSYSTSTNILTITSTDTNTTYSAGTGLNLVGTTFNVSGGTISNSGILQLQDSIQDSITNRAVTPNAVFDYVATTSGAIDTRIVSTGNNLQTQINNVSGLTRGPASGIAFFAPNGALTGVNNRFIYDSGNVRFAIGTGVVGAVVDVVDTGANTIPTLRLTNLAANYDPYIRFTPSVTGNSYAIGIDDSDEDKFKISYGADLGIDDRFIITTGGFVGINTGSPGFNLHVNGTGAFNAIRFSNGTVQTTAFTGIGGSASITGPANAISFFSGNGALTGSSSLTYDPIKTSFTLTTQGNTPSTGFVIFNDQNQSGNVFQIRSYISDVNATTYNNQYIANTGDGSYTSNAGFNATNNLIDLIQGTGTFCTGFFPFSITGYVAGKTVIEDGAILTLSNDQVFATGLIEGELAIYTGDANPQNPSNTGTLATQITKLSSAIPFSVDGSGSSTVTDLDLSPLLGQYFALHPTNTGNVLFYYTVYPTTGGVSQNAIASASNPSTGLRPRLNVSFTVYEYAGTSTNKPIYSVDHVGRVKVGNIDRSDQLINSFLFYASGEPNQNANIQVESPNNGARVVFSQNNNLLYGMGTLPDRRFIIRSELFNTLPIMIFPQAENNFNLVLRSGYVGIKTNTPQYTLHVNGDGYMKSLRFFRYTNASQVPNTSRTLYSIGNNLFWNGSQLALGGDSSYTWTVRDGSNNSETVGDGTTVFWSGAGTVSTSYATATNIMTITGSPGWNLGVGNAATVAVATNNNVTFTGLGNVTVSRNGTQIRISGSTSAGGSPGGSTTNIQYNNAGAFAGDSNFTWTSGTRTLAIGPDGGVSNTSGGYITNYWYTNNFCIGGANFNVASIDSTSDENTAIGIGALNVLGAGADSNTAIGHYAGRLMTIGIQNTLLGERAGQAITTSNFHTMIGRRAGYNNNGAENTIIGADGMYDSSASFTTAIGYQAGYNADGNYSIHIGHKNVNPLSLYLGSGNIIINMHNAYGTILGAAESNRLIIGNVIAGNISQKRIVIGDANTNPNATLEIIPRVSTDTACIIKGVASQSANLLSVTNNAGTGFLVVSPGGKVYNQSNYSSITNSGTVPTGITLDLNQSNIHMIRVSGNTTINLSNQDVGQRFMVRIEQANASNNQVIWNFPSGNIKWAGGSAPTISTGIGNATLIGFIVTSGTYFYDGFVIATGIR